MHARLQATIGDVYTGFGLYKDAVPMLERALDTHRSASGEDSTETLAKPWREKSASSAPTTSRPRATRRALSGLYLRQKRYGEAESMSLPAYEGLAKTVGEAHTETQRGSPARESLLGEPAVESGSMEAKMKRRAAGK